MPPQLGIFFISTKPQLGLAVALFWLVDIWHNEGLRKVIKVFAPFGAFVLLSFFLWGFWPAQSSLVAPYYVNIWYNDSLWPYSIPVGAFYLFKAVRSCKINYAIAASPMLSPYLVYHSWVGVVLAVVHSSHITFLVFLGFWILEIVKRLFPVITY